MKLKLLDDILRSLRESTQHKLNYQDLNRETYSKHFKDSNINTSTFSQFIDPSYELGNAINFLKKEGLVEYQNPDIKILYKGILKISNGGFVKENKRLKDKSKANKFFWYATPITAIIAFILSLVNLLNSIFKWF